MSKRFAKKVVTSLVLIGIACVAFASMGGGGNKHKSNTVKVDFTPIRTCSGFTLKAGPLYRGSMIFGQERRDNVIFFNSVVAFQKGNTTYLLPYRNKVQTMTEPGGSNLQLLKLRLNFHK